MCLEQLISLVLLNANGFSFIQVEYCQGMNFVAGMFLMYLTEEEAYDALVHVMFASNLRELYLPSMEAVSVRMEQLHALLKRRYASEYNENYLGYDKIFNDSAVFARNR